MTQPQPDYNSWFPMAEVRQKTGMSERTIYRQVKLGKLRQFQRPIPGRKPLSVFHPDDVARLTESALKAVPEVLPNLDAAIGPQKAALVRRIHSLASGLPAFGNMAAELAELPPSELRFIGYLSIQEAMRYTGLPEKTIQRFAREGRVQKIGTKYRRKDLEAL